MADFPLTTNGNYTELVGRISASDAIQYQLAHGSTFTIWGDTVDTLRGPKLQGVSIRGNPAVPATPDVTTEQRDAIIERTVEIMTSVYTDRMDQKTLMAVVCSFFDSPHMRGACQCARNT